VSAHLSILQIMRFCAKALRDDEISGVANHVGECDFCHRRFVWELRRRYPPPYTFTLEDCFRTRKRRLTEGEVGRI
jgi:hypothetical protein